MEIWRTIDGTDGKLQVSSEGRIRSLMRDGRILKACTDQKGYLRIRATVNRQKLSLKVHREVAKAFIPNPEEKSQVNHINGIKTDNRVENLEWNTNKENAHHAISHGLWDSVRRKAREANIKQRKAVIATRGTETKRFESVRQAEAFFGSRHISDVLKGKRKHVKGWSFAYTEGEVR